MGNKEKLLLEQIKKLIEHPSGKIESNMFKELEPILESIKDNKFNLKITNSMKNYVIIRLVTTIEHFFQNIIRELIDEIKFDPSDLLINNEIIISLLDLNEIKQNEKITIGRIVSSRFNFQNLEVVNSKMSTILKGKSPVETPHKLQNNSW